MARRAIAVIVPLVMLLAIVLVWWLGDPAMLKSPERIAEAVGSLRDSPIGIVYVVLGFSIGTLVFVPITGLILGTILAFGPLLGFAYALLGALSASAATYWAGRLSGSRALEYATGPRLAKLCEALRHRAFRGGIIARLFPVGNFTVINVLAGSMRVPFRPFFFGNFLGMLPGILFLAFFADQISKLVLNPSRQNLIWFGVAIAVLAGLAWLMRRYVRRGRSASDSASDSDSETRAAAIEQP